MSSRQSYDKFGRFVEYARAIEETTYGSDGEWRTMKKTGLSVLPLRSFISAWSSELTSYYDEDFGSIYEGLEELEDSPGSFVRSYSQPKLIDDSDFGDSIFFVLTDLRTNTDPTWVPSHIKKKYKRAGKLRRKKLRHQWAYENPLNRIHGFLVMKDVTNSIRKKMTLCIDTICASYFTTKKGIGSDLMELAKDFSVALGAYDIVLEVANEFSGNGMDDVSDEENSEDENSEDENSEEEDTEEEDTEDENSEEEDEIWYPDDNVMSILSEELWKKCMRKTKDGKVYYNLEQEYIEAGLWNYFHCALEDNSENGLWKGTEKRIISDKDDPKDTEYGGFWYQKGRRSQKDLMKFYEKFGFVEDESVHTDWCIFGEIPYPSMRCSLE